MVPQRIFFLLACLFPLLSFGATEKFRAMWREDPSTSMVIGWNQKSGHSPMIFLDNVDYGQDFARYRFSKAPEQAVSFKGMNNHFVRLRGLQPNTVYYFVIKDSEGVSARYSFKTVPGNSSERISLIAGGDSRNNREVRREANKLVGKLRPHAVLFNGDMTDMDTDREWQEWFDDWQLTIAADGRMTPVIAARGNHEMSNSIVHTLFDLPSPDNYYALSLGGGLLRIYTLNSMAPPGDAQRDWLERDLSNNTSVSWKIAQYHLAIRPHTVRKPENNEQYIHWATLFHEYQVNLAIESDAHVAKVTWPLRPDRGAGSHEGFIRDDAAGTVYVGEGGWGAPLRDVNDDKPWTRNSGKFNQFQWIFADQDKMEVRTVQVLNSDQVQSVDPNNIFRIPLGLTIWNPSNGDVIVIRKPDPNILAAGIGAYEDETFIEEKPVVKEDRLVTRLPGFAMQGFFTNVQSENTELVFSTANEPNNMRFEIYRSNDGGASYAPIAEFAGQGKALNEYRYSDPSPRGYSTRYRLRRIFPNGETDFYLPNKEIQEDFDNYDRLHLLAIEPGSQALKIAYELEFNANVRIRLVNAQFREAASLELTNQSPGKYLKMMNLSSVPSGRYIVVVRANDQPVRRFRVHKQ
jgi:acid phosphatase type 7